MGPRSSDFGALSKALLRPHKIRNVCVIAHVDHGKTSLCDHLVASNGYLSKRVAGQARFMDAREDEQSRMITIKSSSIPLLHVRRDGSTKRDGSKGDGSVDRSDEDVYLVNLIDSPGHIDFSAEVSAGARICDGALLVVDVLEGFQSQSKMVMRQAWKEGLSLIVCLSKMDRLILEAHLTAKESYIHVRDILETINAFLRSCIQEEVGTEARDLADEIFEEHFFSPDRGNVVFCSALHGWAFTMTHFAKTLALKLADKFDSHTVDPAVLAVKLQKAFWGDYFLDVKTGQVVGSKKASGKLNIACAFVFQPLVEIYSLGKSGLEESTVVKLAEKLSIPVPTERQMKKILASPEELPEYILSEWTPCARHCLDAVIDWIPSPLAALPRRLARFGGGNVAGPEWSVEGQKVLYIAKSMSADLETLRLTGDKLHGREKLTDFVGFGRVFSGVLREGDRLTVCSHEESRDILVTKLFVPAGMDLYPLTEAGPGAVVAVAFGLLDTQTHSLFDQSVEATVDWLLSLKSSKKHVTEFVKTEESLPDETERVGFNPVDRCVTLTDSPDRVSAFESVYRKHAVGLLRFGVNPENLSEWPAFLKGVALLYRADPALHVDVLETGEFILCCQGQVHAERVVQDLNHLYCPNVALSVSPPLVAIRETIVAPPRGMVLSQSTLNLAFPPWAPLAITPEKKERAAMMIAEGVGRQNGLELVVRAFPMPEEALEWMDNQVDVLNAVFHENRSVPSDWTFTDSRLSATECQILGRQKLATMLSSGLPAWAADLPVTQLCVVSDSRTALLVAPPGMGPQPLEPIDAEDQVDLTSAAYKRALSAVVSGFQSASKCGPICEEPVRGVVFIVTACALGSEAHTTEDATETMSQSSRQTGGGINTGALLGCSRLACRTALEVRGGPRVFELMLRLEIHCEESAVGKIHNLLAQRRAQVLTEDIDEKTMEFLLVARIPSTETWDLSLDIRRKSSGKASAVFTVDGWYLNPNDPFPEATVTQEVEEHEGTITTVFGSNDARELVMTVRKRKGLATGQKVISEGANKQRTLGKSK